LMSPPGSPKPSLPCERQSPEKPKSSSTGSSQLNAQKSLRRHQAVPPAKERTPRPKSRTQNNEKIYQYAVNKRSDALTPNLGSCQTTRPAARVSLPNQQCQTAGSNRNRAKAIRRAICPPHHSRRSRN
jgi:hypothetical protein